MIVVLIPLALRPSFSSMYVLSLWFGVTNGRDEVLERLDGAVGVWALRACEKSFGIRGRQQTTSAAVISAVLGGRVLVGNGREKGVIRGLGWETYDQSVTGTRERVISELPRLWTLATRRITLVTQMLEPILQ